MSDHVAQLAVELFESPAAYQEFVSYCNTSGATDGQIERLCSVVGKPSQFVGRVTTLALAIQHWKEWAVWDEQDRAMKLELKRELGGETAETHDPQQATAVEAAGRAWREAVAWGRENEKQWNEWARAERERIQTAVATAKAAREEYVAAARNHFRALRNKT